MDEPIISQEDLQVHATQKKKKEKKKKKKKDKNSGVDTDTESVISSQGEIRLPPRLVHKKLTHLNHPQKQLLLICFTVILYGRVY